MKTDADKIIADQQQQFETLLRAHRKGIKPNHYRQMLKMVRSETDLRTEMTHDPIDWPKGYAMVGGFPTFIGAQKPKTREKK